MLCANSKNVCLLTSERVKGCISLSEMSIAFPFYHPSCLVVFFDGALFQFGMLSAEIRVRKFRGVNIGKGTSCKPFTFLLFLNLLALLLCSDFALPFILQGSPLLPSDLFTPRLTESNRFASSAILMKICRQYAHIDRSDPHGRNYNPYLPTASGKTKKLGRTTVAGGNNVSSGS
jgi:hypothetical protein